VAKTSKIAKNEQRKQTVVLYAERRAELKRIITDPASSSDQRGAAQLKLQKLPRDASPIRVRNRDVVDGRPRGFLRKAGISRVRFRTMAHRGELPGITKSSW
jgi:small subunit ribosomal protein S14